MKQPDVVNNPFDVYWFDSKEILQKKIGIFIRKVKLGK